MNYWIDTNVIIRYLTNDHTIMSPSAKQLMDRAHGGEITLLVSPLVIAECVWVLEGHYGFPSNLISDALKKFLNAKGIEAKEKDILIEALDHYDRQEVDFVDAYVAVRAKYSDDPRVITWNSQDFEKLDIGFDKPEHV